MAPAPAAAALGCAALALVPALAGCVSLGDSLSDPANPRVRFVTSLGDIVAELFPGHAPVTVGNFLNHTRASYYDGLIFHRVIKGFVVQGGGVWSNGTEKPPLYPPIPLEVSPQLTHRDGCLAMARGDDPGSATSQFYFCDGPQARLDDADFRARTGKPGYAVFGRVTEGLPVIRAIVDQPTDSSDRPVRDVRLLHVVDLSA